VSRRASSRRPLTYVDSGVDIAAGEEAVERIKDHVRSTFRPEVVGDIGGFGGLFALQANTLREPLLVSSTDGVGTKSLVARLANRYDTIGIDLVACSVDDIAVQGAEPLFFLDYISTGKVRPERIDAIVEGVADGCRQAGCALLAGEISEHPDIMDPDDFDLVGFAVGIVERSKVLPASVRPGDVVLGIASTGLRCNGYSLARRALLEVDGRALDAPAWRGSQYSLAEELLRPSVIYAPAMLDLRRHVDVHAFAHVTGGGIAANLARVLPDQCDAVVRRGSWSEPKIFGEVQAAGAVPDDEMERVFNLGLGMLAIVPGDEQFPALDRIRGAGHEAWVVGEVVSGKGNAGLVRTV
jgi:phosphoribosylformylglycinamidine cyclo-ligase